MIKLINGKKANVSNIGYLTIMIHLSGEGFDPNKLASLISFPCTILQSIGEKIKRGKKRGEIATGGWCCYELDDKFIYDGKIKKAVKIYLEAKKYNKELGLNIEWFDFSMLFSGCQGNMELNKEEIRELSKLDDGIAMTYISASEIDYKKQRRLFKLKRKLYYDN